MRVHLSDHFTIKKILRAVFPPICMMVFTSIYGIVDGIFVSNFVGKSAFAGVNLIWPVIMLIGAIGFMLGAGGSALVSNTLGEKNKERANQIFTMVVLFTIILGVAISVTLYFLIEPICFFLGGENAPKEMVDCAIVYGKISVLFEITFMLQNVFQSLFVVAEKSTFGFVVTALAGVTNMVLDALFMGVFKWGISGAAVATVISQAVASVIPLVYFSSKNSSLLKFVKTKLELKVLVKSSTNGSSELLSNIAMSVVAMLFNMQLLRLAGENGVAAYGVIMYAGFTFFAIFIGYSIGIASVVGYHNGAKNYDELKGLLKKSVGIISVFSLLMVLLVELCSRVLSSAFISNNEELLDLTAYAFRLYGISFGICGFNIFASGFFTALNNGLVSAIISFSRTAVFQVFCILIFPLIMGIDGVWLSIVFAEILSLSVSFICFIINKNKYHYM